MPFKQHLEVEWLIRSNLCSKRCFCVEFLRWVILLGLIVVSETLMGYYLRHISLIDFQYSWAGVGFIHAALSFITMFFLF